MKRFIKSILVIFLVVVTTTACDDFLTVEPEGELLKEDFWKTTEDVEAALAAMYNALQSSTDENLIWGELRADLHTVSLSDYASIAESNITPSNGAISWSHYYNTINLANTLMYFNKQVYGNDATFTEELMDQVDAEAMFVRALNHFYLVRLWNEVPLVNEPSISDTSSIFLAKSTEKEVLNFLIEDLTKAKDMAIADIDVKGRANKYSIMSLLADIYLWDEQYQNASDYCDSVMMAGYSLQPYESYFDLYYPGNSPSESIFEIQFNEALYEESNPIYGSLIPVSGTKQFTTNQYEVNELLNGNDIRSLEPYTPGNPNSVNKYSVINMFSGINRTTAEEDANFIYYRYADIILIKAEALNELGGHEVEVNELLTLTKERAGITHSIINGISELRVEILDERAREFLAEGKRWFDVLRYSKRENFSNKDLIVQIILEGVGVQQQAILSAYVYDTLSYYLPIPENEILYNPNLVQNSFYNKY